MRRAPFVASAVVCAAILVWWGGDGVWQANTGDARQGSVYRLARFPPVLIAGVVDNAMMPLEDIEVDRLSDFSGNFLMQLIPHDQMRVISRVLVRRDELLKAACRGDVDIIMSAASCSQYDHCLEYSAPYLERPAAVAARTENVEIAQNPFGAGVCVAIEQGSSPGEELAYEHPNIVLMSTSTVVDALDAVLDKMVDVYVGVTYLTRELIARPRYREPSIVQLANQQVDALHLTAPWDRATPVRHLDRHLVQLPDTTMSQLRVRQIVQGGTSTVALQLPDDERVMLASLPPLRYAADSDYMSYTSDDTGDGLLGIFPEYRNFLSRTPGVQPERTAVYDWVDALDKAANGEVDILLGMSDQDARPAGLALTQPIDVTPLVTVGRSDTLTVAVLPELSGKTAALPASNTLTAILCHNMPKIRLMSAGSVDNALSMATSGKADSTIVNLPVTDALIRHHFPDELKVMGPTNTIESAGADVSVRYTALVPLINRALFATSEGEQVSIRNKQLSVSYQLGLSASAVLGKFGPVVALVLAALVALFIKQMQLCRENHQRRRAEETLAQQLSFQRALMEAVPFPLVARDAAQRYVTVNAAFYNMFGQPRVPLLGRTPQELGLYSVSNMPPLSGISQHAVQTSESTHEELTIDTPDGQSRNVLYWIEPFHLPDGQPAGTVASPVDISEIRGVQVRAERLEQRLCEAIGSLPALVCQFKLPPGQVQGCIAYVAGKAYETLGVQSQDLLDYPSTLELLIHEDDRRRMLDTALVSAQQLAPLDQQFHHVGVDGVICWLHARSTPHYEADGCTVWNGYLSDVTAEREQADMLEAAKNAAEPTLHAKDRFLAVMSHEIRTPMNGVPGLIELLQQTKLEGEQKQMVSLVQDSGRAFLYILDDILNYAKVEVGRLDISPSATDLREVFDGMVGLLASRVHEKVLATHMDMAAEVPASVSADGIRLRQILFNLLSNAIKFTDVGSVRFSAKCTDVTDDTAHLAISVSDTGISISPEVQATLFAPFVQAERSTTRRCGGTGPGLAISRQLAGFMGGELVMESVPGHGTVATLRLVMPMLEAWYALPQLAGYGVAIVVDDATVRHSLAQSAIAVGLQAGPVINADILLNSAVHSDACTVHITTEPCHVGPGNTLSINPLSWHVFVQACEHVLPTSDPVQVISATAHALSAAAPPCDVQGARILMVEDHSINHELIVKQLCLLGYRVMLTEDGAVVPERLHKHRFDALLIDCHMPRMDGFDLAQHIRHEEGDGSRPPIVAITATMLAEEHVCCRAVGMDASLPKSTVLVTLQEALSALCTGDVHAGTDGAAEEPPALSLDDLHAAFGADPITTSLAQVFLSSLVDNARHPQSLLDAMDRETLRRWAHRTSGALALLYNPGVDAVVEAFRHAVHNGSANAICVAGARMTRFLTHINGLFNAFGFPAADAVHRTQVTDS